MSELRGGAGRIRRRIGERRIAHAAAIAAPVRGILDPHQDFVERDHGRDLRLRQHRAEILGDEGDLGIGLGGVRIGVGVVGCGRRRADIGQHALGVEGRNLRGQIARRHRQIAGDANERPHPHHVAVADAGDGGDAHHVARGGRLARWRQAVALVQAGRPIIGAEGAAQRAFDPLRHPCAKVISPSSDAKTAPPMRAAPHRPVRMVPLNHCTDTRRRSMTAASEPSTDSGGSWPRSIMPISRP